MSKVRHYEIGRMLISCTQEITCMRQEIHCGTFLPPQESRALLCSRKNAHTNEFSNHRAQMHADAGKHLCFL